MSAANFAARAAAAPVDSGGGGGVGGGGPSIKATPANLHRTTRTLPDPCLQRLYRATTAATDRSLSGPLGVRSSDVN